MVAKAGRPWAVSVDIDFSVEPLWTGETSQCGGSRPDLEQACGITCCYLLHQDNSSDSIPFLNRHVRTRCDNQVEFQWGGQFLGFTPPPRPPYTTPASLFPLPLPRDWSVSIYELSITRCLQYISSATSAVRNRRMREATATHASTRHWTGPSFSFYFNFLVRPGNYWLFPHTSCAYSCLSALWMGRGEFERLESFPRPLRAATLVSFSLPVSLSNSPCACFRALRDPRSASFLLVFSLTLWWSSTRKQADVTLTHIVLCSHGYTDRRNGNRMYSPDARFSLFVMRLFPPSHPARRPCALSSQHSASDKLQCFSSLRLCPLLGWGWGEVAEKRVFFYYFILF